MKNLALLGMILFSSLSYNAEAFQCHGLNEQQAFKVVVTADEGLEQNAVILSYSLLNRATPELVGQYTVTAFQLPSRYPDDQVTSLRDSTGKFNLVITSQGSKLSATLNNSQKILVNLNCQ